MGFRGGLGGGLGLGFGLGFGLGLGLGLGLARQRECQPWPWREAGQAGVQRLAVHVQRLRLQPG